MQKPIKVMTVFGTRPEAIKMAPIILEMKRHPEQFQAITTVTAQHREMLDQVLEIFHITPDFDLNIMRPNQSLNGITTRVLTGLEPVLNESDPDIILVHGDTTTTFAASVAAFYHHTMLGHVEAGLRTWDKWSPYPEEMNRQLTDVLSDLYFAPTELSRQNLRRESHDDHHIFVTGNTAIDALKETVRPDYHHEVLDQVNPARRLILLTMHRRENQGAPMREVFQAIRDVVDRHSDVEVVYPVHLSPVVQQTAEEVLGNDDRIHLIEPLDVVDFHNLAARSYFIMTDSGGVQEEAPSLGKPVLVLRTETERPEGVDAGTLKLVGTKREDVIQAMEVLLTDPVAYQQMADAENPYGDGHASERILKAIWAAFQK
ncbi:non-hydrolyzing UDP-N-acetylglucosamine 2-epimerase [Levilactobacillus bambusae]|uniref:UDP-N-acetylglucosamine 2-epimerase (non-hydrolyzing) n=1 Tax=Levilactobacillus bambusae TaxID=2024736 RepID=A0A2V1N0N5_9LACO|nr:UDP-N-acetylglucosamine 2-epimerase (non-hydrolyzing) [Levilactobacillus bambusae]PWF99909.1 UDP-N-acetylglucosamine 2-epimerase (non-hydrolyzing) [Levilactobacillus bambusae]